MIRKGWVLFLSGLFILGNGSRLFGAPSTAAVPDFREVYDLLKSHVPNLTETELNRAAVQGMVKALAPKVALLANTNRSTATTAPPLVSRSNVFDRAIAYIRVGTVSNELAEAIQRTWEQLSSKAQLKGLALDLRYCDGTDYAAAAQALNVFLKSSRPMLNWGSGMTNSHENNQAITVPLAVLINKDTAQAAEALAAALRQTGVGLLLGSSTAGQALVMKDLPLHNGDTLRVAVGNVELGDGTALNSEGVKPDILVSVSPADEHAYYADAFRVATPTNPAFAAAGTGSAFSGASTNARRPRINEAELVRERREGPADDADVSRPKRLEPDRPTVNDPALARALDLLKGLAVVRQSRS